MSSGSCVRLELTVCWPRPRHRVTKGPVMSSVAVELDRDLINLLRDSDQPVAQTATELIVLELYRQGRLSSGKSAELLGMPRFDFIRHASDLGIPFFRMSQEEWEAESAAAERLAERLTQGTA
ncbi:MAG: UPF0175 family protein [Dehalococcoidia bacterium]|nr:UPF0175 family protein [Dehalococcoidia bacterium]